MWLHVATVLPTYNFFSASLDYECDDGAQLLQCSDNGNCKVEHS